MTQEYPLAYFITWTTYGTWLPGDRRGWVRKGHWGVEAPNSELEEAARRLMTEDPVVLTPDQRTLVDTVIVEHCKLRGWTLHARNVRSNHVHMVVSAQVDGEEARKQIKAWTSRRLSEQAGLVGPGKHGQCRWWTEGGDIEWLDSERELENASRYVAELQDYDR